MTELNRQAENNSDAAIDDDESVLYSEAGALFNKMTEGISVAAAGILFATMIEKAPPRPQPKLRSGNDNGLQEPKVAS